LSKGGRPPFDPVFMLKVLVLQKYHNLSDEQTEFQIGDRFSFMQFLGLQPGDSVPDEKTIWDFKGLLGKDGRDGACQQNTREQNAQIHVGERAQGFEADATKGRQTDCDASWTMKNSERHDGYEDHAKVDAKSMLVVSYKSTAANVYDSQVLEDLIDDEDETVFVNSAYTSKFSDERLLKNDRQNCIQFKAKRGHSLTGEETATNNLLSRIRVRCEHIFGRMSHMALARFRSIGLASAKQHIGLSNLVHNIDRYAFLCK
jgi:IS5 family transposase